MPSRHAAQRDQAAADAAYEAWMDAERRAEDAERRDAVRRELADILDRLRGP